MKSTYPEWIYDRSGIDDPLGYGERAVTFLRLLKHPKSTAPKHAFQLDFWQERIVRRIYGPRNPDGTRIVKRVVLLLPRGNRKTSLSAALALLHTLGPERVPGGEVIFAAADRKQASIGFREALQIVMADRRLESYTRVSDAQNSTKRILYRRDGTFLETISADAKTQHGRTPTFALADELHIWRGNDLWEAITTGLDKIPNTLLVIATTAGRGQDSVAWSVIDDARKVARGEIDDPSILPILFEAQPDDDWKDEAVWRRVNPGLAHGYPDINGFRRAANEAERRPAELDSFRQLKLNVWLDKSTSPFVDMKTYDEGEAPIDRKALAGKPCWIGVDMSKTDDLTSVVACFRADNDHDPSYIVLPTFFCPADNLRKRGDSHGAPYPQWAKDNHLITTPGNVIDHLAVKQHIIDLCGEFDVQQIGFDVAYSQAVLNPLAEEGYPALAMNLQIKTQASALHVLERAIVGRKFQHGGHPVLRWNFANIEIYTGPSGLRTMHKRKSGNKIDGAFATWMAVYLAAANENCEPVYNDEAARPGGIMYF